MTDTEKRHDQRWIEERFIAFSNRPDVMAINKKYEFFIQTDEGLKFLHSLSVLAVLNLYGELCDDDFEQLIISKALPYNIPSHDLTIIKAYASEAAHFTNAPLFASKFAPNWRNPTPGCG